MLNKYKFLSINCATEVAIASATRLCMCPWTHKHWHLKDSVLRSQGVLEVFSCYLKSAFLLSSQKKSQRCLHYLNGSR